MELRTPAYVVEERLLRRNLTMISEVARRSGAQVVPSLKAFALWPLFPMLREYGFNVASASGAYEARLAKEELGGQALTYSPAFTESDFQTVLECSDHVTFNSLEQYRRFRPMVERHTAPVSCGLRINHEYSEVKTELYNPCAPGSRLGVTADQLPEQLPEGIEGFLSHCHCESDADELERNLYYIEERFAKYFPQLKWLNLGGGHLMTRRGYDVDLLVYIITNLRNRYPWLHIILEPGSAFAWETGTLVASVVDIVENKGIKTAVLDVSFTCHMPDCLEMPYQPQVRGAETLSPDYLKDNPDEEHVYRLGGCSCLSGDYIGCWRFTHDLQVGEYITFEDMIHYTTVKTTMFNGVAHPSIMLLRSGGELQTLRNFTYDDYKRRMC